MSSTSERAASGPQGARRAATALAIAVAALAPAVAPAQPAAQPVARSIVLALDDSGSMKHNDPDFLVRRAVTELIGGLDDRDAVGLVVFDGEARLVRPLRPLGEPDSRAELLRAVEALRYTGDHTNIPDAVERCLYELKERGAPAQASAIVLVTDGVVDTGSAEMDARKTQWLRAELLDEARARGVRIFGVAFTEDADYELLQAMAHATDGDYLRALTQADVQGIFADLQAAMARSFEAPAPPALQPAQAAPEPPARRVEPAEQVEEPSRAVPFLLGGIALAILALGAGIFWRRTASRARRDAETSDVPMPEASLEEVTTGRRFPLTKHVVFIGRAPDCDVVLSQKTVSGQHAKLEYRSGVFYVTDLRSLNGTYVNDERIQDESMIRDGDIIRFDRYAYAFRGGVVSGAQKLWSRGERTVLRLAPTPLGVAAASAYEVPPPAPGEDSGAFESQRQSTDERLRAVEAEDDSGTDEFEQAMGVDEATDLDEDGRSRPRLVAEDPMRRCRRHAFTLASDTCSRCDAAWCADCGSIVGDERLCPECGWKL